MKKLIMKYRLNESGISLVEVIASIVILSVILISIFTMLTQSGKTTKNNEDIVEATYLAQTEMEKLYAEAQLNPFSKYKDVIYNLGFINGSSINEYEKEETDVYYKISVTKEDSSYFTTHIIIHVSDKKGTKPRAQMQNTLKWRGP